MMGLKNINIHQWVEAEQTKKLLTDDLSKKKKKKYARTRTKQYNAIKSKCLKWIVKNILPKYK